MDGAWASRPCKEKHGAICLYAALTATGQFGQTQNSDFTDIHGLILNYKTYICTSMLMSFENVVSHVENKVPTRSTRAP